MATPADLHAAARRHADEVVRPGVDAWDAAACFPRDASSKAAAAGLLGLFAPTAIGGQGLSYAEGMRVFEELGRGDAAYAFTLSMHNAVTAAIGAFAAPGVRRRWGRALTSGEALGGFSLTEPHAGSDAAAITTRLTPDFSGFRLNGAKAWVTLCGEADVFLVACRTGTERGTGDVAMVVLDASREGVETVRLYETMTSAFLPIGEMRLHDVRIEPDEVLAPPGSGFQAALGAIDVARTDIAAIAVGLAVEALETALAYTRDRALFGGTVLDQQAIQFALADVETDIVAGRLLYQHAAELLGTRAGSVAAAHAKRFCPDMALKAAAECAEMLGSYGWLKDVSVLPRLVGLARMLQTVDGTREVQRVVIARDLVRRARTLSAPAATNGSGRYVAADVVPADRERIAAPSTAS
jgi:alkylation response protein AidB-like acyl-CoA dehydrogenase